MDEASRYLRAVAAALLVVTVSLVVAACGEDSSTRSDTGGGELSSTTDATLVLDFNPNAVHAGIYRALEAGYYEENELDLEIIQPTSTADTLRLIDAGRAEFGIADGIDVATQITEGRDAKGIMALLERPPGGLITLEEEGITDPKELEGKTVGITGVPSDTAILNTVVADAGGDPRNVDAVTIGFNGARDLESGKVSAFTGFIPADGVQIETDGIPIESFPLDEWGGPSYPGLVVFSTQARIEAEPALMQAFVAATVRGYEDVIADPEVGIEALLGANRGTDEELATASLDAYLPLFEGDASRYGIFEAAAIEGLSEFMIDNDLSAEPFTAERYATNEFVESSG